MSTKFVKTTYKELELRIGEQKDRIRNFKDLKRAIDTTVYITINPIEIDLNGVRICGNSFIHSWNLNKLYNIEGHDITEETRYEKYLHSGVYSVDLSKHKVRFGKLARPIINVLDYNVVPNKYSNNAIFFTESGAKSYQLWLRIKYQNNKIVDTLPPNVFKGTFVIWEDFLSKGMENLWE